MNDTRSENHHGCLRVMNALVALLGRHGMVPNAFWPVHADWRGSSVFESALAACDLVVVNGEGTLHHDRPAARRLLEVAAEAKLSGKPIALINSGWEANGPELLNLLPAFSIIAARDRLSAERMRRSGSSVRVVPDLSLFEPAPSFLGRRSGIGFTDNVDRHKAILLDRLRRQSNARSIALTWGEPGVIGFLRFVRAGLALREDWRRPLSIWRLVRLRSAQWQVGRASANFLKELSQLELLVSGRFHACTLALATATPFIAQSSNTGKIAALIRDAGLAPWRMQVPMESKLLISVMREGWSPAEEAARRDYLEQARLRADALFAEIAEL